MSTNPKRPPSLEQILKAAPMLARASIVLDPDATQALAAGSPITADLRDELLRKCDAGTLGYYELDVPMLAYEQKAGEDNRNYVGFRDGEMRSLGRTGRGKPFLRDHAQRDSLARGGTLIESVTENPAEGHYQIRQTVRLTEPWAIAMYLRGNMTTVSIGWIPTGPVLCSSCNTPVFEACWHFPGDRLEEYVGDDGKKRKRRARAGAEVVRWIYTAAELIETSCVPVPGVPTAEMDQLRATLAASWPALAADDDFPDEDSPPIDAPESALDRKSTHPNATPTVDAQPEHTQMADQTDPKFASVRKALMTALALPEEHRAYAATLSADEAEAFCGKGAADRELAVKAALDADPVVFEGKLTGAKVRRSEGAKVLELARRAEEDRATIRRLEEESALAAAARDGAEVEAICTKRLAHLPGSNETRTLLVAAVRKSGATKEQIDDMLRALEAASHNIGRQAKAPGSDDEQDPVAADGPQAEFDALVAAHAAKHNTDARAARLAVVGTEKGRALYTAIERSKKLGAAAVARA